MKPLLLLLATASSLGAQVVINEIMYHPVEEPAFNANGDPVLDLTNDVHEFLEIANAGPDAVALEGWKLTGDVAFTFPKVVIQPGEHRVIAKNKERLLAVVEYGLTPEIVDGPYEGQLNNEDGCVKLVDASGQRVDAVCFSAKFPWAISADGLGASDKWTGIDPMKHQYRGRSLERVSATHDSTDPANWVASPLEKGPSPGKPNGVSRPIPWPIVDRVYVTRDRDEGPLIGVNDAARITVGFTSREGLGAVRLEYFIDDINKVDEPVTSTSMVAVGDPSKATFAVALPGAAGRSVARYRILAERVDANGARFEERVAPRLDDPFGWRAYFVQPDRVSPEPPYDLFLSEASLRQLQTNARDNPNNGYKPALGTLPNGRWNNTEAAILVYDNTVYDVRARYQGSFYRRSPSRYCFAVKFPAYQRFFGKRTMLITDKDNGSMTGPNAQGHKLFDLAGLPTSKPRRVALYFNSRSRMTRLELDENDEFMLERWDREMRLRDPSRPVQPLGRIFKSSGAGGSTPFGSGAGTPLNDQGGWKSIDRYSWVYSSRNEDWKGFGEFKKMIDEHWAARGGQSIKDANRLRAYLNANWDVDMMLTYLCVRNWMSPWDDSGHNYFLWRKGDGKWVMLPWDFDSDMADPQRTIYNGVGGNLFKDSFLAVFREQYKQRMFLLNNTLMHPENLAAHGFDSRLVTGYAAKRFAKVNSECNLTLRRPDKPMNLSGVAGETLYPPAKLVSSAFRPGNAISQPHASTIWSLRAANGSYLTPAFQTTSKTDLTSLAIPFDKLEPGQTYFWRCAHVNELGETSLFSSETSFQFGGQMRYREVTSVSERTIWRYQDSGEDLGTAWRDSAYDDSAWAQGPAVLGQYSAALVDPLRTPIKSGKLTTYFRTKFPFEGDPQRSTIQLRYYVDDGAVFYLNGEEIHRVNVPFTTPGGMIATMTASREVASPALEGPVSLATVNLRQGENVLAVEVHQVAVDDHDVSFGASLAITSPVAAPPIVLSEIHAGGDGAQADAARRVDWIEIHNPSATTVSLANLRLTDNPESPSKFVFPTNASLAAGERAVIWCDGAVGLTGWHAPFALDGSGEGVWLLAEVDRSIVELDAVRFGAQPPGYSLSKAESGWRLSRLTPGAANEIAELGDAKYLRLNEWMADPAKGDDWLELYNAGGKPIDLAGLLVSDGRGNVTSLAPLSFIGPGGFSRVAADDRSSAGHLAFKLNEISETLGLYASPGVEIDRVRYTPQSKDVSQGRSPDGGDALASFPQGTPGYANRITPATAPVDSDHDGQSDAMETLAGTDPNNSASSLRFTMLERRDAVVVVKFWAEPNRSYALEARPAREKAWRTLAASDPVTERREVEWTAPLAERAALLRLKAWR